MQREFTARSQTPGGIAPNVIPAEAQILYAIRAPKVTQVKKLYERMCDIAKGAALITGTTVDIKQVAAYSNLINNDTLADLVQENLEHVVPIGYTEEELAYAKKFQGVITELDKEGMKDQAAVIGGKEHKQELLEQPMWDLIVDKNSAYGGGGSTDVGDVSWGRSDSTGLYQLLRSRYSASFLAGCCTGKIFDCSQRDVGGSEGYGVCRRGTSSESGIN